MINVKPFPAQSQQNKLEYFNAIGLIFQNYIYLNRNNILVEYEIDDIKQVHFNKERNLNRNYFSFLISLLIAFASYSLAIVLGHFKGIGFIVSSAFFMYSLLNKSYSYRILLITINQNIVSLSIKSECKQQATKLVALIKIKIKDNAQYLKAS